MRVMRQLSLFPKGRITNHEPVSRDSFSHNQTCAEEARLALEERYRDLLEETDRYSRQLVSFQANKTELLHSWVKYREGFSAELVQALLEEFGVGRGDRILDPFAGSSTTQLVGMMLGIDAVGIELLPNNHLAWEAKSRAFRYDVSELKGLLNEIDETTPAPSNEPFPHIAITRTAFPYQTERDLMAYVAWIRELGASEDAKTLLRLVLMSILERVSYTRKDGQYLRWDGRAEKMRWRNKRRVDQGKKPFRGIDKGELPTVKGSVADSLRKIIVDIEQLQKDPPASSEQQLIRGNTLYVLPQMGPGQFDAVITSPPYANRYDYTRTYALELAFLGVFEDIFDLRQGLLSCTVENRPKLDDLGDRYRSLNESTRFKNILDVVTTNPAMIEVNAALRIRNERGEINNAGVLTMIDQYFTELAFVFAELGRVCKPGAHVAFVNDNVRYGGEIIPVDLLSTDLARDLGFDPVKVYVLPQRKGNSSQQMRRFGREPLRKSITVWRMP
jgi:DNA modification methylase